MKTDWVDIEELVREMMEDEDADSDAIERWLYERYEVSFDNFHKMIEALLPFTSPAQSFTGTWYYGFVKDDAFIVKSEQ